MNVKSKEGNNLIILIILQKNLMKAIVNIENIKIPSKINKIKLINLQLSN